MLQLGVALSAFACFASFVWSIARFFRAPHGIVVGMRLLTGCFAICMLAHLISIGWFYQPRGWAAALGIVLYLVSLGLFWLAIWTIRHHPLSLAFSSDPPQHLVDRGAYSLIRHPLYVSYILAWIAGVVATGQPWLWVTVALMAVLYWKAASLEENKFLTCDLRSDYLEYRQRAGKFWPRIVRRVPRDSTRTTGSAAPTDSQRRELLRAQNGLRHSSQER